jgi:16S rRNA G966 N2-methylase RsmD
MRIIGGKWSGRKLNVPSKSWPVRPTTDFAREALFNILDNRIDYESISALDLFGGTGVHSVELASRGCMDITFVDRYRESTKFMQGLAKGMEPACQSGE